MELVQNLKGLGQRRNFRWIRDARVVKRQLAIVSLSQLFGDACHQTVESLRLLNQ